MSTEAVANPSAARARGLSQLVPGVGATRTPLSLRKNFSWTLVGNIVYVGCQFATLVVLAHLGGPVLVGLFALGQALTEPIILFSNLSLRSVLATDAKELFSFRDYLGLRLTTTTLALLAIAAIALASGHRGEALAAIVAIGVTKAFEAVSDVCYGLLQQRERMDRIATSMMIKGPLGLIAFSAAVALTHDLVWGLVALAIARAVMVLTFDVPSVAAALYQDRKSEGFTGGGGGHRWLAVARPRWERRALRALTRISLPLGIVILLVSLSANIPRYFIAESLGTAALGIFATMIYFVMASDTLAKALSEASVPRLAAYHADGNASAFRRLLGQLLLIALIVGLAGIVAAVIAGQPALQLLYGAEFAEHSDVLIMVMAVGAVTIVGDYLGMAITAMRIFSSQVWVHLARVAVLIAASGMLIRGGGLIGAAQAALLGSFVVAIGFCGILVMALRTAARSQTEVSAVPPALVPDRSKTKGKTRTMRITFLVRSLTYGGAERQLSALARGLHERGHRVVVAVFYGDGPLERELREAGVPIHVLDKSGRWDLPRFLIRLVRFLREEQPEILHGYLDTPNLLGLGARLFVPVKVVAGVRSANPNFRDRDWLAHLHYHAEQHLTRFSDLVVINSRSGFDYFGPKRLRRDRTVVIPNGIDANRFRPDRESGCRVRRELGVDEQAKLVGLIGRLDPVKDHDTFLRSASLLALRHEDVRFVCVGAGPDHYSRALRNLADELGLSQRLIWAGSRDDMTAVYNALDIAVLCSVAEGFPNVVGEAMACGVPCVVTDVGDSAWIVGDTGHVVPPRDPDALHAAIDRLLGDLERGSVDARTVRDRIVANFSVLALLDNSEWAFRQLLVMT